jgi:hypothetical protein
VKHVMANWTKGYAAVSAVIGKAGTRQSEGTADVLQADEEYMQYSEIIRDLGSVPMPYDVYKATLGWRG